LGFRSYTDLAKKLQSEGYDVFTIDLRGHGESTMQNSVKRNYQSLTPDDFSNMETDLDGLIPFLTYKDEIYGVGASIGASVIFRYAATRENFKKLVLLSAGKNYGGINLMTQTFNYGNRPILVVAATGDKEPMTTLMELKVSLSNATTLTYGGSSHGTNLLDTNRELYNEILDFFGRRDK